MKKRKSIVCITLALLMVFFTFAAVGCGDSKVSQGEGDKVESTVSQEVDQSSSSVAEVKLADDEINLWWFPLWSGLNGEADGKADDWPKAMGKGFMEKHPNVKEVNVELLDWGTGIQKLDTAIAAGNPPDMCYIDLAWLPKYIKQDMVIPVDQYLKGGEKEDFYESTTDYATYDGKLYAYPILIAPRVMYANKTLLDEMGLGNLLPLSGDHSWTIDQFKEIVNKFPYQKDGKKIYAAQVSTVAGSFDELMWLWNFGATMYNDDETQFMLNSDKGIAGTEFLAQMFKEGKFRLLTGGAKSLEFWSGEFAFGIDMAYTMEKATQIAKDKAPEAKKSKPDEFVAMQFPKGSGIDAARTYSGIGGIPVFNVAGKDENHTRTVAEFASYITAGEKQNVVKYLGCFPTRRSAGDIYGGDENAAVATSMLAHGEDLGRGEATSKIFTTYVHPAFESVFLGKKTAKEALDELTAKANEVLNAK